MNKLSTIKDHNRKYERGLETFLLGVNSLSDRTSTEMKRLTGLSSRPRPIRGTTKTTTKKTTTKRTTTTTTKRQTTTKGNFIELDWVSLGAVNPIRDQGYCGSCWAFSAVTALEGAWFIKTGQLLNFSEQQLVDCSSSNYGCNGGWMSSAWDDLKTQGVKSQDCYPYTASDGVCDPSVGTIVANVTDYVILPFRDEAALTDAIKTIGPISVAMYASSPKFSSYKSGVYYDTSCGRKTLDHAVTAVGLGRLNGVEYYLIRNSWGTSWGMNGYFMIARNKNSHCGIADYPQYPVV